MLKIKKSVKLAEKLKLIETKRSLVEQQKQLLAKYSCFLQYKQTSLSRQACFITAVKSAQRTLFAKKFIKLLKKAAYVCSA